MKKVYNKPKRTKHRSTAKRNAPSAKAKRNTATIRADKSISLKPSVRSKRRAGGHPSIKIKLCKLCPKGAGMIEEHTYESHVRLEHGGHVCSVCGKAISKKDPTHKYKHRKQERHLPEATFVQGGSPGLSKRSTRRNPPRKAINK
jgi:hypothetical protein